MSAQWLQFKISVILNTDANINTSPLHVFFLSVIITEHNFKRINHFFCHMFIWHYFISHILFETFDGRLVFQD